MQTGYSTVLVTITAVMAAPVMRPPPQCDLTIVNNIMTYWSHAWPPDNVTLSQLYYSSGRMRLIAGTQSPENFPYKCRTLNFNPNNIYNGISAIMKFKNDGVEESIKVREYEGLLILPGFGIIYNVIVSKGVYAAYKCMESANDGVVPAPPEAGGAAEGTAVAPEAWVAAVDEANTTDINNALGVMALIGLYPDHSFDCSEVVTQQHNSL